MRAGGKSGKGAKGAKGARVLIVLSRQKVVCRSATEVFAGGDGWQRWVALNLRFKR